MELLFLLIGLFLIALGAAAAWSEIRARLKATSVKGRVVGFSTSHRNKPQSPSFHSVAQYVGPDGRTYYIVSSLGSSAPLHRVGDDVTILVKSSNPQDAVFKSSLSFVLAAGLASMGLLSVMVFRWTFRISVFSLIADAVVLLAVAYQLKKAWRKVPLSLEELREHKKEIFGPKIFTWETKDQIAWADPTGVTIALTNYGKSRRFALPILFALGFAALFFGYRSHMKVNAFLEEADTVTGNVLRLQESESSDASDSTIYAAVVEFRDKEEHAHTFVDRFSASPPLYHSGETVRVLYDRTNPSAAQIDRGLWNHWLAILLYSVGTLFVALGYSSARRHARLGLESTHE